MNGGAVSANTHRSYYRQFIVRHCYFHENSAVQGGGALFIVGGGEEKFGGSKKVKENVYPLKIENCTFVDNKALETGQAILSNTRLDLNDIAILSTNKRIPRS